MTRTKTTLVTLGLVLAFGQSCDASSTGQTPDTLEPVTTMATTTSLSRGQQSHVTTASIEYPSAPVSPEDQVGCPYLEEIIPPCTPVAGSTRDPCKTGKPPSISNHDWASEAKKEHAPPLHDILNYWGQVFSLSTHIVLRGTVLPETTRCEIYATALPTYRSHFDRKRFAGWEYLYCFSDVRVNEYLLGTGPPQLSVIMDWHFPLEPLEERIINAYEGVEGILFLSTGRTLQLEAWEMAFFWDVQKAHGERVIAPDKYEYPQTPENLALLDFSLADYRIKITEAAAIRAALTRGRVGRFSSLPLLIADANDLPTYYRTIGAVYDDPNQAPAKPPPVPGANNSDGLAAQCRSKEPPKTPDYDDHPTLIPSEKDQPP